jgi:hypothetical protein
MLPGRWRRLMQHESWITRGPQCTPSEFSDSSFWQPQFPCWAPMARFPSPTPSRVEKSDSSRGIPHQSQRDDQCRSPAPPTAVILRSRSLPLFAFPRRVYQGYESDFPLLVRVWRGGDNARVRRRVCCGLFIRVAFRVRSTVIERRAYWGSVRHGHDRHFCPVRSARATGRGLLRCSAECDPRNVLGNLGARR